MSAGAATEAGAGTGAGAAVDAGAAIGATVGVEAEMDDTDDDARAASAMGATVWFWVCESEMTRGTEVSNPFILSARETAGRSATGAGCSGGRQSPVLSGASSPALGLSGATSTVSPSRLTSMRSATGIAAE
jgi:hypothetical protein